MWCGCANTFGAPPNQRIRSCLGPLGGQTLPTGTRQHAGDVRVDDGDVVFEGEREHGASRVRTHTGQGEECIEIVGKLPVVSFDDQQ